MLVNKWGIKSCGWPRRINRYEYIYTSIWGLGRTWQYTDLLPAIHLLRTHAQIRLCCSINGFFNAVIWRDLKCLNMYDYTNSHLHVQVLVKVKVKYIAILGYSSKFAATIFFFFFFFPGCRRGRGVAVLIQGLNCRNRAKPCVPHPLRGP